MEYRRPILQEMDTQEYDWVRLYTEKSPAKPFYSIAGDSAREIYLCVNKKLAPNWTLIEYQEVSTLYYLILFIPSQTHFSFPIPTDSSQDYSMPLAWQSKTHGCLPQPLFHDR